MNDSKHVKEKYISDIQLGRLDVIFLYENVDIGL